MKIFGREELQTKYANHHFNDDCNGEWEQTVGAEMPFKVDEGIVVILQNPPLVRCNACGAQYFVEGFEKQMLTLLIKHMLCSTRSLSASHLRFIRTFVGMSQKEVSEELDISNSTMSRFESRKDPAFMQSGDQVKFKLLMINKLGFTLPKDVSLWRTDKAKLVEADSIIQRINSNDVVASA